MSDFIPLTPEILKMLEQAGITAADITKLAVTPKSKVRKKNLQIPAAEYILESVRHCKLCGTDNIKSHYMKQCPIEPHILESHQVNEDTPDNLPTSQRYSVWKTCKHCRTYLRSLEKSTLVDMVISEYGRKEAWLR